MWIKVTSCVTATFRESEYPTEILPQKKVPFKSATGFVEISQHFRAPIKLCDAYTCTLQVWRNWSVCPIKKKASPCFGNVWSADEWRSYPASIGLMEKSWTSFSFWQTVLGQGGPKRQTSFPDFSETYLWTNSGYILYEISFLALFLHFDYFFPGQRFSCYCGLPNFASQICIKGRNAHS